MNALVAKLQSKKARVVGMSALMCVLGAFPAFASDAGGGDLSTFTSTLTTLAAWLWKEVGLFCTFVLSQPMLMLALSIPFIGVIVNFFLRIFKSV